MAEMATAAEERAEAAMGAVATEGAEMAEGAMEAATEAVHYSHTGCRR